MKPLIKHYRARKEDSPEEGGFTLIELLIVVLILGILAAIVAFAVGAFTSQSAVAACNTDAKSVESAIAAFSAANNGNVPSVTGQLTASTSGGPYLHKFPVNPNYYTFTLGTNTGTVKVVLNKNDPAFKADGYSTGASGAVGHPVLYDNFSWGTGALNTQNVCAGA